MSRRRYDERGSVTPMIAGFFVLLAVMVAVVVDASAAYLQRSGLDSVADGAALTAATALNGDPVYTSGAWEVDEPTARAAVEAYLAATGARQKYPGLVHRVTIEGDRAVVRVSAPLDLPLDLPGGPANPTVGSTGSAVIRVSD